MKLRLHPDVFASAAGAAITPSVEGARLMLVEGWTCLDASKRLGISHQAVNRTVTRIAAKAQAGGLCPSCGRAK